MPNIVVVESCVATEAAVVDPGTGDLALCAWDRGLESEVADGLDRIFFEGGSANDSNSSVAALIQGVEAVGGGDSSGFNWSITDTTSFGDTLVIGWYGLEAISCADSLTLTPVAQEFPVLAEAVSITAALSSGDITSAGDLSTVLAGVTGADAFVATDAATPSPAWPVADGIAASDGVSARDFTLPALIAWGETAGPANAALSATDGLFAVAFALSGAALSSADAFTTSAAASALPSFAVGDVSSAADVVVFRSFTLADFCLASDLASPGAALTTVESFGGEAQTSSAFAASTADAYSLADVSTLAAANAVAETVLWTEVISATRQALDLFVTQDFIPVIALAASDIGSASTFILLPAPTTDAASITEVGTVGVGCFDGLSVTGLASVPTASISGLDGMTVSASGDIQATFPPAIDGTTAMTLATVTCALVVQELMSMTEIGQLDASLVAYDDIGFVDEGLFPDLAITAADGVFIADRCKGFPAGSLPGPKPYVRPRRAPLPVNS